MKKVVLLALALTAAANAFAQVALTHVHGLAYSPDGQQLMIPSHHGLAVYRKGKWSKAPGPQHDYMGFAATSKHLYSSVHPAPNSGLVNPFGLMRSRDGGKTWETLALEGETDFHLLAASWNTNAIYVWNPEPSSRIRDQGLYYTGDAGKSWKPAKATGLQGRPISLAVHPDDARLVAVGTEDGVFESSNAGENFNRIAPGPGTMVVFDLDARHLWHGGFDKQARLSRARLGDGSPAQISLPRLGEDAVAYMAQNPKKRDEYAIATFKRSVFLSRDEGKSWAQIADQGKAK
jgi:photosystem II stability/assembly factor-like uncharacterized protein